MKRSGNWFWGIALIAGAIFLVVSQVSGGALLGINVWTIVASVALVGFFVQNLVSWHGFFGVVAPLAGLYWLFWQPLGLPRLDFWVLWVSALLLLLGLEAIFHRRGEHSWHRGVDGSWSNHTGLDEGADENHPYIQLSFGKTSRFLHADALESGRLSVSFGELLVYFDQVTLKDGQAQILMDASFGTIQLFVPKEWEIVNNLGTGFGSIKDFTSKNRPAAEAPRLILNGDASFGEIRIQYS
ncbi:MAG: cell wall-active antibiotics response protein [Christensenellaceae bacterium]|jgi:predicted membrane protein|nr:cell wall-active antibiotics response protein [Christensenellaceae bacterium]